jgi:hypothetical protein
VTTPAIPAVGDPATAAWADIVARWGLPAAYTPALTASTTNPTLGTASSVTGSYTVINKWVTGTAVITFGTSGTAAGSGNYMLSLPVVFSGASEPIGFGRLRAGGTYTHCQLYAFTTTTALLQYTSTAVNGALATATQATPAGWAANDEIRVWFGYRTA